MHVIVLVATVCSETECGIALRPQWLQFLCMKEILLAVLQLLRSGCVAREELGREKPKYYPHDLSVEWTSRVY